MLVSNSTLAHGWKTNERAKDKPEEKGAKGKHAPANKGIQAEGKNSLEENKREKKLDECTGESEKVNSAGPVFSKVDSSVHVKERMVQPERTEMSGQTKSIKVCPKQKETGVKAAGQKSGLVSNLSSGTPSGSQNMDKTSPGLENLPQKHHSPKSKETEKNTSRLSAPTRETEPSTSKSGGEVVRTRLSINVQMTDGQEKTLKSKEGTTNSPGGKSVAPISSVSIDEGTKHLSEPCTAKQISKSSRTEPIQEQKGGRLSNKPSEKQAPKLQGLLAATSTEAEEKADSKCKTIPCLISVAKDTEKDPGSPAKSPKEKPKIMKDCEKEVKPESMELCSFTLRRRESRSNQGAEKPSENTPLLAASKAEEVIIDDSPPPPAPFEHRIVSIKQTDLTASYSVCHHEVLGGGRFGQVHKCTEKSTGLCLAAKIIKVKVAKEREEVKNEINIMNQLNHVNLIQLYDAFESKNNLTLIMEYVDGGELFDRIIDENYSLTELDAILFTKQICEGIHYLHQQYILHLDLKPENILCVNHTGNQIKIIDFGLARRYKPRDKLKVNFGTPEFLAPEVVNYDFVSFPTDMWSVGVIAYMLLSGLSPFLGETDTETMNYIVNCSWDFDAEAFEQVSEEAKEFVSRLLIKEKSGRTSAANCLKHEWLTDLPAKAKKSKVRLKSQLLLQRYMAQRKWKKHFYVVAAANRLRRFPSMSQSPA
ncbi:myosin light chain kinase 3 isoform X2 [Sceloporus undulatus]|uniref:myosin light chain kinase 3 isoform X2 n=1 Tax=Sceloporus undulatus TaxID=8520 RepID=UPI001C4B241E|nr:myosin light chain kinase 3 isoform X2 [Sceloporus undulatus]XP_042293190.1 myosin light chain kinase 3 isoform X2 [Sceloporus undulatus]XP_042293191.1 myosin light chain kinase 3 isoform X2 [Sceloporus undulatus]